MWEFLPSQNQWIWQDGSDLRNQRGNNNSTETVEIPGARDAPVSWVDPNQEDTLWLFGGFGYGNSDSLIYLNDLWRYRKEEGWVWIAGNSAQENGVYEDDVTSPGGRWYATGWTDKEGGLWLFGGSVSVSGVFNRLNDLWRFDGNWKWIGGSNTTNAPAIYTGDNQTPGGIEESQVWQFPNGTVWLFGGTIRDADNTLTVVNDIWEWEPTYHQWKWLSGEKGVPDSGQRGAKGEPNVGNILGSRRDGSTAIDSQGSLWLFGGSNSSSSGTFDSLPFLTLLRFVE